MSRLADLVVMLTFVVGLPSLLMFAIRAYVNTYKEQLRTRNEYIDHLYEQKCLWQRRSAARDACIEELEGAIEERDALIEHLQRTRHSFGRGKIRHRMRNEA